MSLELSSRWTPLEYHVEQSRLWASQSRFRVVPAGRRSGKTELAKRFLIMQAMACTLHAGRFIFAAPTREQVKRIYWEDLKAMVPKHLRDGEPRESDLKIRLKHNGTTIECIGMDVPQRVEGSPVDGIVMDEFADMRERAWLENVRPALSTRGREGWAWFIGVPGGRNHYYRMAIDAQKLDRQPEWGYYHWKSADILARSEVEAAMRDMDELTFKQEYEGDFITFEGRVYYPFTRDTHARTRLLYFPDNPLVFALDFNVAPGSAVVAQEHCRRWYGNQYDFPKALEEEFTAVIGEVHIPRNSNTEIVCNQLISTYGTHKGEIFVYGDATGGARGTSATAGSDWDIARKILRPHFGDRVRFRIGESNPLEKVRVNAVNARLRSADGAIRLQVDPFSAPTVVEDFEGVVWLEGADCQIDKWDDLTRTHWTDGLGYYIHRKFPLVSQSFVTSSFS